MKQAPFKFGEVVTGKYFADREEEIQKLQNNFSALQNTIIISPRRYGKSSLVREAANRFAGKEKDSYFIFIDMMYVYSEDEFYREFATRILKETSSKLEEFIQLASNMFRGAKVTVSTGTGEPGLEFGINYIKDNTEQILNLPKTIARKKRKKVIICIDEFQNISRFEKHEIVQGRLRSVWQHHQEVGYMLYGSKQTMMNEIFHKTNSPFYRFGEVMYLKRIREEKLKAYVKEAFQSSGKTIPDEIASRMIHTVENHPYYLQQFARNVWLISGKNVSETDFVEARSSLLAENVNFYNELLDSLTGYQINFLRALLNEEKHLYSADIIGSYRLGSSANVRKIFEAFLNKGIIVRENGEVFFADPVFKLIALQKFQSC